jgi:hypothetical protein
MKLKEINPLSSFLAIFCFLALLNMPVQALVTVNPDSIIHTLSTTYHGVNYVAFWDDVQGSNASRDALRRAGVQIIRFPGGVPGNWWDWAIATQLTSTTTASLWTFAKAVGAKLLLQTNWKVNTVNNQGAKSDSTGQHQADWIQWCKTNNVDAPFWEIGNEPELELNVNKALDWDTAAMRPYFDSYNQQVAVMQAQHPDKIIMGPATCGGMWYEENILPMFLAECDTANTDAISVHFYPDSTGVRGWNTFRSAAQGWDTLMQFIRRYTNKPVYITEWNALGGAMYNVDSSAHNPNDPNGTVGAALANADVIGAFARSGVAGHAMFGAIHRIHYNWGILGISATDGPGLDKPSPTYFILPIWTAMGNQVLPVTNTADSKTVLSAWAHKKSDGSVQVMLINKGAQRTDTVAFRNHNPVGVRLRVFELRPVISGYADRNTLYNGQTNPTPGTTDLPQPSWDTCDGQVYIRTLPAYSITMLDFAQAGPTKASGIRLIKQQKVYVQIFHGIITINPQSTGTERPDIRIFNLTGVCVGTIPGRAAISQNGTLTYVMPILGSGAFTALISWKTHTISKQIIYRN